MHSPSHRSIGKTNSLANDLEKVKLHLASLVLSAEDGGAKSKYNAQVEEIGKRITNLEEIDKGIVRTKSEIFKEYRNGAVWLIKRRRTELQRQLHHRDMAIKDTELTECLALEVENYDSTFKKLKNSIQALEPQREMKEIPDNIVKNLQLILDDLNAESYDADLDSTTGSSNKSNSSS